MTNDDIKKALDNDTSKATKEEFKLFKSWYEESGYSVTYSMGFYRGCKAMERKINDMKCCGNCAYHKREFLNNGCDGNCVVIDGKNTYQDWKLEER